MIIGKSQKEIEKMRAAGQLVGRVLLELRAMVEPGMTTIEVNDTAEQMIRDAGAYPTFKGYNGFPYSICASVNEQVVHGFPSSYELKQGDIFSIDVGATPIMRSHRICSCSECCSIAWSSPGCSAMRSWRRADATFFCAHASSAPSTG